MNKELIEYIRSSEIGNIKIDKKLYIYMPKRKLVKGVTGEPVKRDYLCSNIFKIKKFENGTICLRLRDILAKGKDANCFNSYMMNPIELASYRISESIEDFKTKKV